jgi:hypothetical protein
MGIPAAPKPPLASYDIADAAGSPTTATVGA